MKDCPKERAERGAAYPFDALAFGVEVATCIDDARTAARPGGRELGKAKDGAGSGAGAAASSASATGVVVRSQMTLYVTVYTNTIWNGGNVTRARMVATIL